MSSCTPMWMWVYSRGLPFTYLSSGGFNFSVDGWSTCGSLAVFPRLKGRTNRTNSSLFFLFDHLVALILNRCVVTLVATIIPGPHHAAGWNCFLLLFLFNCQSGFIKQLTCRTTADQACFSTSQLCLCVSTIKFRNIWTWNTWSKLQLEQFFPPRGSCRHTGNSWQPKVECQNK